MILTNAHTHLELTHLKRLCPKTPVDFVPWLRRLIWELRQRPEPLIQASIEEGLALLKAAGVAQVGDISATGQSVIPLLQSGLHGVVFLEVVGLNPQVALERLENAKQIIQKTKDHPDYGPMQVGLSLHAPYSCHPQLLRQGAMWCRKENIPLCIHAAESPAETFFLQKGEIPSTSWLTRRLAALLGFNNFQAPKMRPIPYLTSLGVLEARPLLVHTVQVTDEDIKLIADTGCSVVHCPRSNHLLSCGRMPLEKFLSAGIPVFLGSDSLASSPSLDICEEAVFAHQLHKDKVTSEPIDTLMHTPFPFTP
jgi:cytosine/adenosine deaminase-related metal-dependent hydrolase